MARLAASGVCEPGDAWVQQVFEVCAPFGLTDLFAMVVRPNVTLVSQATYEAKAERWRQIWPGLTVLPWPTG